MAVVGASDNLTVRAMRRRGCAVISNPLNEVQVQPGKRGDKPPPFTMVVMVGIHHPQRVHNEVRRRTGDNNVSDPMPGKAAHK
uniref:Uncharacterized protein n=1 Tax=Oryza nivara TaxID=4536 RepID=A0A0E0I6Q5_ORYNI